MDGTAAEGRSSITALLGPTNTGKTHRAVLRMLEHRSGMIGLPLRLLAREVYDRITASIGEGPVALVTGEEKRIPARPRYWVCTVEAMPVEREVDFVAVDEIQLAAHPQRGHVFTERLLHARGRRETWFMGAETMRPLVERLVPTATILRHPRLSSLRAAGGLSLAALPPRTAVIAFSTARVYGIAERLRRKRGGAAVVLGALSPRARNAQVALYQAGEVEYMVATDAIGMGLNMDVDHVAFADLRKYDGREARDLEPAELAQIAGRAGRYLNDGSFGTLAPLPELPLSVVRAIEAHAFPSERTLVWRNADLSMDSIDDLVASLRERPRLAGLRVVEHADDFSALLALGARPEIRALAGGREAVALLWEVCRIPDYRQLLLEAHVALLAEVFTELAGRGRIEPDFMTRELARIDDPVGDIETLMARIASIRTFTYIAHHDRWVDDPARWQATTRAIEDRLSDALHAELVARFVDRGAPKKARAARPAARRAASREEPGGERIADGPFAALRALKLSPRAPEARTARDPDLVNAVVDAPAELFQMEASGRILFGERFLGALTRGPSLVRPDLALTLGEDVGAGARSRIQRRLLAVIRDFVTLALGPLRLELDTELSPAGRGLLYQLEQGLGTVPTAQVAEQVALLGESDHQALRDLDVRLGRRLVFVPTLLKPAAVERRAILGAAYLGREIALPSRGAVSFRALRGISAEAHMAMGYLVVGSRALRADIVERVVEAVSAGASVPLASWIGCPAGEVPRVLDALGLAEAPALVADAGAN